MTSLFRHMYTGSAVSQSSIKAATLSGRLDQINRGQIADLKTQLDLELDLELLTLGSLIDWDRPGESDARAIKIIRRIAKQRTVESHTNNNPAAQTMLLGIYDKAVSFPLTDKIKPQP